MATSLLALIDDIATILDDVAVLTKVAAKKTAGVLGDDLALNANQVTGLQPSRELPVVWAVAKGSAVNKAILVPAALLISAFLPWLVTPLLMLGGAFLCFEGVEKLAHKRLHSKEEGARHRKEMVEAVADERVDLVAFEKQKIKGAVRTDFILSAEIVVITLGTVTDAPIQTRVLVLIGISALMTVGVYGLVGGIVKLDDLGRHLACRGSTGAQKAGAMILWFAPQFMKLLSVAGTVAMFLVGGGILTHAIGPIHHAIEAMGEGVGSTVGGILRNPVTMLADALVGIAVGILALLLVNGAKRALPQKKPA